ncbi:MAG TPA: hypothetical protein PLX89_18245, partial [Verrucomicrobiota bacterium]|nr:hypothetical protein [Verrucomicrobiota bacterium]
EATPDYAHYVYPYVIWGFLEPGETPADALAAGFLPSTPALDRFYLGRQIRIPLADWKPSSENRRVLRKAANLRGELISRTDFDYSAARRDAWLAFAEERFGAGVMPPGRLDGLMSGAVVTHLLHFTEGTTGADVGTVLLYVESSRSAIYSFAFYSPALEARPVGMAMMTRAVEYFAQAGLAYLHLGTCYTEKALYKAQFEPLEFFNGFRWSRNLDELKHLVRVASDGRHRLETPDFLAFQPAPPRELAQTTGFRGGRLVTGDGMSVPVKCGRTYGSSSTSVFELSLDAQMDGE